MDSNCKKVLDRIYRIDWIEGPSAGGHLACRRRKKSPSSCKSCLEKEINNRIHSTPSVFVVKKYYG